MQKVLRRRSNDYPDPRGPSRHQVGRRTDGRVGCPIPINRVLRSQNQKSRSHSSLVFHCIHPVVKDAMVVRFSSSLFRVLRWLFDDILVEREMQAK